jgi:hypothetical protein
MLALASRVVPNKDALNGFTALDKTMRDANETEEAILIALLGTILDGMRHGNWPKVTTKS